MVFTLYQLNKVFDKQKIDELATRIAGNAPGSGFYLLSPKELGIRAMRTQFEIED